MFWLIEICAVSRFVYRELEYIPCDSIQDP